MAQWFWVVIVDDEKKTFNVVNPTTDDSAITERTAKLQQLGRQVRCYTTGNSNRREDLPALDEVIARGPEGYSHDSNLRW